MDLEENTFYNKNKTLHNKKRRLVGTRVVFCFACAIIVMAITAGIGCSMFYGYCALSGTTYDGCWCDKYNHNTRAIQTCIISVNHTSDTMTCRSRFGYWTCDSKGECPIGGHISDKSSITESQINSIQGKKSGWGNCVFTESKTDNYPITTCDNFIFGREICFESTKTCCWYSTS